jgi:hypothetical protein
MTFELQKLEQLEKHGNESPLGFRLQVTSIT